MAKKKPVRRKTVTKKVPARKKPAKKPVAGRRTTRVARKPAKKKIRGAADLGRARVSGTAELDQYFLKDYEARQVFAFLGVKTLKELEGFSSQEIIDRLTAPMLQSVNRIRKALALQNRCLAGDQNFAIEFKQQMQAALGR
ncbi:MAG: hypothetical protein JNG89_09240 [Planctomycetaceae bacterium]|nr:hypothetical protein [Planctomycetaceae bacterium]